jgi:hypothetical protein
MRKIGWILLACVALLAMAILRGLPREPASHFSKRRHPPRPAQEREALPMPRVALDRG